MVQIIRPTWAVNSIFNLDPIDLQKKGISHVFSDLDNTLIAWHEKDSSEQLKALNDKMHDAGIKLIILSNNTQKRVGTALKGTGISYVSGAHKPLPFKLKKAVAEAGIETNQAVMVGDQLLTDLIAGNLAGVRTILVKPLVENDSWTTKLNRSIENNVLKKFKDNLKWKDTLD